MKKRKTWIAALLIFLLLFTACGAESKASMDTTMEAPAAAPMEESKMEMAVEEPEEESVVEYVTSSSVQDSDAMAVEQVQDFSEKIIYSGHVNLETTDFDEAIAALDRAVREYGGFVQDSSVDGWSRDNGDGTFTVMDRSANYVVRIPCAKFDAFMAMTNGIGNVTSSSRTAENVTSQYTDYEARLSSLNTQEERLLAMLEKSEDLESLITLEQRLSEVRYEIESIERNLRNLDQRLAYSTVTLWLQEVEVYTPTVTVQRTFGEKLSDAFADGWRGFVRGLQGFVLWLAESLPSLVVLAVIAGGVVLVIVRIRKRAKGKKAQVQAEKQENDQT